MYTKAKKQLHVKRLWIRWVLTSLVIVLLLKSLSLTRTSNIGGVLRAVP